MSSANTTVLSQKEYDQRRKLWEGIKSLIKSEQEELYRILKRNEVEITENTNGIFFDVGKLSQSIITEIEKFLQFCSQNRINFEERDKEMESLRQEV
jgi:Bromodomain extra-terminal - transcription regulation